MEVYHILKEPYWNDPLSVVGAEIAGGPWSPPGMGILYTISSPALALLETLVHFPRMIYNHFPRLRIFSLQIPDDIRWIYPDLLPDEWAGPTAVPLTRYLFAEWLEQPADLALAVSSAVLAISFNYLLHPKHPLYKEIELSNQEDVALDWHLWSGAGV